LNYTNILNHLTGLPAVSAIVDIDYTATTLSIYSGAKLLFVRDIPVSWEMFSQALTRLIVSDQGNIELSLAEAEIIKNTYGIPQDESQVIKGNIRGLHIVSLLRPLLEALVRELKLSFNYFAMNFDMDKPAVLFTDGGGADLKNIEDYLRKELNIKVSRLPLPDCVYWNKLTEKDSQKEVLQKIANTVAVALGDSKAVNLLPSGIKTQKTEFLQRVSLRIGGITIAAVFLVLLVFSKSQVHDYQNRLKTAQAHLEVIGGIKNLREKLLLREELITKIQKKKIPANGILKVMGVLTPNKVILDELVFNQSNYNLVLRGTVSDSDETAGAVLSDFMGQLETSSFFTEASLISSQGAEGAQIFEIKCSFPEQ
jgi:Tfp pilus assembly protein PilN